MRKRENITLCSGFLIFDIYPSKSVYIQFVFSGATSTAAFVIDDPSIGRLTEMQKDKVLNKLNECWQKNGK